MSWEEMQGGEKVTYKTATHFYNLKAEMKQPKLSNCLERSELTK